MATKFLSTLSGTAFGAAGDEAVSVRVSGDSVPRVRIDAGGKITWGSGSATGDVTLYRSAANALKTDDTLQAVAGVITATTDGAPSAALADGAIAIDTTNDAFYFRSSSTWSQVSGGGGASLSVSDGPPDSPSAGDLWFESDTGRTLVYYADGSSNQWVEIGLASASGASGADGKIQFSESDSLTSDTLLHWDNTNNRLGVGTASPGYPLDVSGTSRFTGAITASGGVVGALTGNADTATALATARAINGVDFDGSGAITVTAAAGTLSGSTLASGVTASSLTSVGTLTAATITGDLIVDTSTLKVDSSNNRVGIGTASPSGTLDVEDATNAFIYLNDSGGTVGAATNSRIILQAGGSTAGTLGFANTSSGIMTVNNEDGPLRLVTTTADVIDFYTTDTRRMTLTAAGLLGIGDATPDAKLDVYHNADNEWVAIFDQDHATGYGVKITGDMTATNDALLKIEQGSTQVFRMTQAGLIIGDETVALAKLHIKQGDSGVTSLSPSHHIFGESDGDMGMTLCAGTGSNVYYRMGDSDDAAEGGFNYDNADDSLKILVNNKDYIQIKSTGNVAFNGDGTDFMTSHGLVEINQPADNDESGLAVRANANGRTVRLWVSDAGVGYLSCGDGGGQVLTLNEGGGNVGIGTTTPLAPLSIKVAGSDDQKVWEIQEVAGTSHFWLTADGGGTGATGNKIAFESAWAENMLYIRGDGNIGLGGTTTTDSLLSLNVASAGDCRLTFQEGAVDVVSLMYEGSAGAGDANRLNIWDELDDVALLTVKLSGLVYIGANAGTHPGTDGYLNVESPGTTPGVNIFNNTASATAGSLICRSDVGGAETLIALIETNGDFQSATDSYGATSSDERLKTTEPCRDYLNDLLALDVVNFQFTKRFVPTQVPVLDADGDPVLDEDGEAVTQDHETEGEIVDRDPADYSIKQLGLVAQQVEPHIPGLVKTDDYGMKTLKTSILIPMLLQSVQTLTARIAALEAA